MKIKTQLPLALAGFIGGGGGIVFGRVAGGGNCAGLLVFTQGFLRLLVGPAGGMAVCQRADRHSGIN